MNKTAQFTPGPWFYNYDDRCITNQDGVTVINVHGAMSGDNTNADIAMLAAAPAMYGELSVSTNLLCRALPYLPDAVAKELVKQRQINMQVLSQAEGRQA